MFDKEIFSKPNIRDYLNKLDKKKLKLIQDCLKVDKFINNRNQNQLYISRSINWVDLFNKKNEIKPDKFGRITEENYLSADTLNNILDNPKYAINVLLRFFDVKITEICSVFDDAENKKIDNVKIVGQGASGLTFLFDNINDMVVKRLALDKGDTIDRTMNKVSDSLGYYYPDLNRFVIKKPVLEVIIGNLLGQYSRDPKDYYENYNKNFLKYEGVWICKSEVNPKIYILMERFTKSFRNYYENDLKEKVSVSLLKNIFFQFIFSINMAQKLYKFVHHDPHMDNIGILEIRNNEKYLSYQLNNQRYFLPNQGILYKMFDYDNAIIKKPIELTSYWRTYFTELNKNNQYKKTDDEYQVRDEEFKPGFDIAFFIGSIIIEFLFDFNETKTKQDEKTIYFIIEIINQIYKLTNRKLESMNPNSIISQYIKDFYVVHDIKKKNIMPKYEISLIDLTVLLSNDVFDDYKKDPNSDSVYNVAAFHTQESLE